eukprot:scaffold98232_cov26-Prasinocladus_malaysianus.AAC.1
MSRQPMSERGGRGLQNNDRGDNDRLNYDGATRRSSENAFEQNEQSDAPIALPEGHWRGGRGSGNSSDADLPCRPMFAPPVQTGYYRQQTRPAGYGYNRRSSMKTTARLPAAGRPPPPPPRGAVTEAAGTPGPNLSGLNHRALPPRLNDFLRYANNYQLCTHSRCLLNGNRVLY